MSGWKPIPGYEGLYEAHYDGRVASVKHGPHRILKPQAWRGTRYFRVSLYDGSGKAQSCYVHTLILSAFAGPRPEGLVTRHLDGNPANNARSNLAYGTYSENQQDSIRHGTHAKSSQTHCAQGHEYNEKNTRKYAGRRYCRACKNAGARARRAAR